MSGNIANGGGFDPPSTGWHCAGPCEYSDAWRCARARRPCDRVACACRCHRYLDKAPKGARIAPNGNPMMVARPKNPALAVRLTMTIKRLARLGRITAEQAKAMHADILKKQEYSVVGFLAADGARIIVRDDLPTLPVRLGDSFIASNDMRAFYKAPTE